MKSADIPDNLVIEAIRDTPGYWRTWTDVFFTLDQRMRDVPRKVFVAKVGRLSRKGVVHACFHSGSARERNQCRGDLHLPEECCGC